MEKGIDIDELVRLLDASMEDGSGHLDVQVHNDGADITVTKDNCKGASCAIPTLDKEQD